MSATSFFNDEIERFLDQCVQCGLCIDSCPVFSSPRLKTGDATRIIRDVFDFFGGGRPTKEVLKKAFSCTACFKCVHGLCPKGLSALIVNQAIKQRCAKTLPGALSAVERDLPEIQGVDSFFPDNCGDDLTRITTPKKTARAEFVFFPGCRVYRQPNLLSQAMDLTAMVTDHFDFLQ